MKRAHVVVVGNEKGGTGKSTISMHLIVSLLEQGLTVGSMTSTPGRRRCRAISPIARRARTARNWG